MKAARFTAAWAAWVLFLAAGVVASIGCSATSGEDAQEQVVAGRLAELQTGMPTGNPPAWYTERLEQLDYEVKALRYERSDLLTYDVVKGAAAFHVEVTLDPETETASRIEIQPRPEGIMAASDAAGSHGETTAEATAQAPPPATATTEPQEASPTAEPEPPITAAEEPPPAAPEPQPSDVPSEPEPVVALPAGTFIATRLNDSLDSGTAQPGDRFSMMVPEPVSLAGITVLPAGSRIWGYVAEVEKARRPNGAGRLVLKADVIDANGASVQFEGLITADGERLEGEGSVREDLKEIAVGAGVGGLVGGLLGGGKGVLAGVLIGGGGTFVATKGEEVRLPPDTPLYVELREEVVVPVAR